MLFTVISSKISGGSPELFGYQVKSVLSGSMEPGIKTGSIIAVKTGGDMKRFKENDIITFVEENEKLITHRIVEVVNNDGTTMYRTKGDNNNAPDLNLVHPSNVIAEYKGFTIPYIGYFAEFASSKNGILVLMILPGIIIFVASVISLWRTVAQIEKNSKLATATTGENHSVE